jgi:tRNA nucleotidyltransferase/poly(A) polymerase
MNQGISPRAKVAQKRRLAVLHHQQHHLPDSECLPINSVVDFVLFESSHPIKASSFRMSTTTATAIMLLSLFSTANISRAMTLTTTTTTKTCCWQNHLGISSVSFLPGRRHRCCRCHRFPFGTSLPAQDSRQLRFFGHIAEEERSAAAAAASSSARSNLFDIMENQNNYENESFWFWKYLSRQTESLLVSHMGDELVGTTSGKAIFFATATKDSTTTSSRAATDESFSDVRQEPQTDPKDKIRQSNQQNGRKPARGNRHHGHSPRYDHIGPRFTNPPSLTEPKLGYGPYIILSQEERDLFQLLRRARSELELSTTLRVAGGWVRDKLLATPEFARIVHPFEGRLTSKYKAPSTGGAVLTSPSAGRQGSKVIGLRKNNSNTNNNKKNDRKSHTLPMTKNLSCQPPVDIDIALDDMLGREFAEHLNQYLVQMGEPTHSVGVVLKNPEKSKHLETATMKVGTFWIDFVNLRAEEYTQDSRIPDLMRIGSPAEDAFRRDLTINSLFYNVNNGQVEDWTGRGFDDLRRGVVSTPLAPLTTLLDDPLRTLRSVRFAARLRFTMDDALIEAAKDDRVRKALAEKVSRERIGCEVDLMLRSPDPVGAMRLLITLNLARTVFPIENLCKGMNASETIELLEKGLRLLCTNHEHLEECNLYPPVWCNKHEKGSYTTHGVTDLTLSEDDEARRFLWYASFLKPFYDYATQISDEEKIERQGRKANRSVISKLLVDELKRPTKEVEAIEKIMKGSKEFRKLMDMGGDVTAESILLSSIQVKDDTNSTSSCASCKCFMNGEQIHSATENDPVWEHAMEFRLVCANVMRKVGPFWRAALFLAMSEGIEEILKDALPYVIEGDIFDESQEELREHEIERYDALATAMQQLGLVGIWGEKPLFDGGSIKKILPRIPQGPAFGDVTDEQQRWMTLHPCAGVDVLAKHLIDKYPEFR